MEEAARLALAGEIDAVVTGPIHKARMYEIGFQFPGQTEFFAARCGVKNFAMLLTGGETHRRARHHAYSPRATSAENLNTAEIVRVGSLLADFLVPTRGAPTDRGRRPESACRRIRRTRSRRDRDHRASHRSTETTRHSSLVTRHFFTGPLSPDTVFHRAVEGEFDAVLCMYHDQGLIPLKLHAFHEGVNVTLGLPFPRTSPDHGTAFDIAGRGIARADSMIAAIRLAVELRERRSKDEQPHFAAPSRAAPRDRPRFRLVRLAALRSADLVARSRSRHCSAPSILIATYSRFRFTTLVYTLIALHIMLLCVGGHYTYARVPFFTWLEPYFGWHRNHFDRLGHFTQGFVPALIARELFIRLRVVTSSGWRFAIVVLICMGISALYELLEWSTALWSEARLPTLFSARRATSGTPRRTCSWP